MYMGSTTGDGKCLNCGTTPNIMYVRVQVWEVNTRKEHYE